jgi:hypothetical protein
MTLKLTNRSAIIAGSPTMLIVVGPERHYVLTPINLLTLQSSYLRRAHVASNDTATTVIELPKVQPELFDSFVQWLYKGDLHRHLKVQDENNDGEGELTSRWALGEFLGAPGFQNYIMDKILKGCGQTKHLCKWPSFDQASFVYYTTTNGSALRKLVANALAFRRYKGGNHWDGEGGETEEKWRNLLEEMPELSIDTNCAPIRRATDPPPWSMQFRNDYMVPGQLLGGRPLSQ